ncbi:MAG: hypothetical protein PHX15_01425 [Candidatus Nanoarchaeia archaeon]|jgi:hypothetical protein|nr:hypothetical protein [Candidatus Nanoarchaeia archaeon]MDD3993839.1 hypothetical protein [Candidatus Nanoarchaeia archaeon]MDD4563650.1 hypothetical protein [Candidatus Nanoarchaeia archaeon]
MDKIERAKMIFLELESKKSDTFEEARRTFEITSRILNSSIH